MRPARGERHPLCPTLTFLANIADYGHLVGCSALRIDRVRRNYETALDVLRHAHGAGSLMAGTDTGFAVTPFGEWHARELEIFVEQIGMTPLQAITCATKNSALPSTPVRSARSRQASGLMCWSSPAIPRVTSAAPGQERHPGDLQGVRRRQSHDPRSDPNDGHGSGQWPCRLPS
jgi:hypothetical protein